MTVYLIKLLVLIPVMGGLIFASLWIYRKYQSSFAVKSDAKKINLIEIQPLGNFAKLAAVEFEGKRILLSVSRARVNSLAVIDIAK